MVRTNGTRAGTMGGFTLVELMIVLLVIAVMSLVAAPLTMSWINSARLVQVRGLMEEAMGTARANALRNAVGMKGDDVGVVALCMNQQQGVTVLGEDDNTPLDCADPANTGEALWNASLPANVSITVNNQPLQCFCFNNTGDLIDASGACGGGCATNFEGKMSAGSQSDDIVFY